MPNAAKTTTASNAVKDACKLVEKMLHDSPAYRKVETGLYVIKQGSSLVMVSVHPWHKHAVVRLSAQLVRGVNMAMPLAVDLLELNALMRFGSFGYVDSGKAIIFSHTLLDRELSDPGEFMETVRQFVLLADEYDDRISARFGGQTMQDLLEETVLEQIRQSRNSEPTFKLKA